MSEQIVKARMALVGTLLLNRPAPDLDEHAKLRALQHSLEDLIKYAERLEAVGSCWNRSPAIPHPDGECGPEPLLCELPAGHPGAHRSGRSEWMKWDSLNKWKTRAERAEAKIAAALAAHRPVHAVFSWNGGIRYEEPCPDCHGKAGVHPCGCWSDEDIEFVCKACDQPVDNGPRTVTPWPCATVRILTGEEES